MSYLFLLAQAVALWRDKLRRRDRKVVGSGKAIVGCTFSICFFKFLALANFFIQTVHSRDSACCDSEGAITALLTPLADSSKIVTIFWDCVAVSTDYDDNI